MDIITLNNNIYGVDIKCFNDFIYKKSISLDKLWDEEIIDEILNNLEENTDIIDIGANIGLITLGILKKANQNNTKINNIHCFECDPKIITLLSYNISSIKNIIMYPFALSDTQELCNMTTLEENMGCNYIFKSNNNEKEINYDYSMLFRTSNHKQNTNTNILAIPLDSIKYNFKKKVSIIKIDVEGYEIKVIKGAMDIISIYRPIIIIEIFEKINFKQVMELFINLNYKRYKKIQNKMYNNQDYVFFPD
jgi:FkbM family methyltransferase